jgi:cellulose synthase/poly-beta-1,6-N-acetylglucosamine synthase-like glycosyltransferase
MGKSSSFAFYPTPPNLLRHLLSFFIFEKKLLTHLSVTFFTNLIYTAIRYTVANGDVSPFVGHNALLRWSALQSISFTDPDSATPSTPLFWSESHVSEDFDMSLRLQCAGYLIRLASYTSDGFKEGVSLTVYDELARWEKYAYGCNELLFQPFKHWLTRGPFTALFRKFLASRIRLTSKITILAYIGTYYALGAAWSLTVVNYFLVGWFQGALDHYYLDSFRVYFSLVVVFSGLGNVALAVLRYRLVEKGLFASRKFYFFLVAFSCCCCCCCCCCYCQERN